MRDQGFLTVLNATGEKLNDTVRDLNNEGWVILDVVVLGAEPAGSVTLFIQRAL